MNAEGDKQTDGLAAWAPHYDRVVRQRHGRRVSRIRPRRGLRPNRVALAPVAAAMVIAGLALDSSDAIGSLPEKVNARLDYRGQGPP